MTKDAWDKRQAQWKRFEQWDMKQRAVRLSAAERLAEIGALVDFAYDRARGVGTQTADVSALMSGIRTMRQQLAVLN